MISEETKSSNEDVASNVNNTNQNPNLNNKRTWNQSQIQKKMRNDADNSETRTTLTNDKTKNPEQTAKQGQTREFKLKNVQGNRQYMEMMEKSGFSYMRVLFKAATFDMKKELLMRILNECDDINLNSESQFKIRNEKIEGILQLIVSKMTQKDVKVTVFVEYSSKKLQAHNVMEDIDADIMAKLLGAESVDDNVRGRHYIVTFPTEEIAKQKEGKITISGFDANNLDRKTTFFLKPYVSPYLNDFNIFQGH